MPYMRLCHQIYKNVMHGEGVQYVHRIVASSTSSSSLPESDTAGAGANEGGKLAHSSLFSSTEKAKIPEHRTCEPHMNVQQLPISGEKPQFGAVKLRTMSIARALA